MGTGLAVIKCDEVSRVPAKLGEELVTQEAEGLKVFDPISLFHDFITITRVRNERLALVRQTASEY